ncbi:winged helix-turn-helix domain-containing protein [Cupriavidus metallidurans]|uniref:OmpR/PhoB-type domain-containing protein n=1 Tax=Cupriavidus metallidurans TaxID=119219 RepID=A0A482J0I1_9BURK|nr:winged helix-turn-helix domain-containing protein [Cupriavidus metallidurans]QBP12540.1 hypothetical protein DDF84_022745 [Cupriavidus metallidurans]
MILSVEGTLQLDCRTRRLRLLGRTEILSPSESRLLACLLRERGRALDRMHITRKTCGRDWVYGDRTVDVLVSRLRLRLRGGPVKIVSVHGVGYMLADEADHDAP